jgi:hypothetical protein
MCCRHVAAYLWGRLGGAEWPAMSCAPLVVEGRLLGTDKRAGGQLRFDPDWLQPWRCIHLIMLLVCGDCLTLM